MTSKNKPAKGIRWNLKDLYSCINDPQIKKDVKLIERLVRRFNHKYKGKLFTKKTTSRKLLTALSELEKIYEKLYIYSSYPSYLFSQKTSLAKRSKFFQESKEFSNKIYSSLLWFELEWNNLDNKLTSRLFEDSKLSSYKHYLTNLRVFKPYQLSEKEEIILTKKDQTSSSAFVRLYDEINSSSKYELKIGKNIKKLSYSELHPYLKTHPKRNLRKDAAIALTTGLEKNKKWYAYILNTLLLDKKTVDDLRGYQYPQQQTFLQYELSLEVVNSMVKAISNSYRICEKFYLAKKKLLNLKRLYEWDRYSLIYPDVKENYDWGEAKEIILESFKEFSVVFKDIADLFFDNGWIDAEITEGKIGGAFCSFNVPSKHPYILLNYSGKIDDILTLAHELGHAVHAYLARKNNLLEFSPPDGILELASVFAEMLVFDKLFNTLDNKKLKTNLLVSKLQGTFATVFRQTAFYLFESEIHMHRRKNGEMEAKQISDYFQKYLQQMFGKSLTLTDNHKLWWMPILHFYHYNFYVFTYAFGENLTMALYSKYKSSPGEFVQKYLRALSLGGRKTPLELTRILGVDITKNDFWNNSLKLLDNYVDEFTKISY